MKDCLMDGYAYYHHPLREECEKEFKKLPILFGRKKKEAALREKYKQKGLKVVQYEDFLFRRGELWRDTGGGYKPCATFINIGNWVCGIDGSDVNSCEQCKIGKDCKKLQNFLWHDLFD
ncbi:MAG: hypothetical protein IJA87_02900 [Clostridia bacterium]|nr:hypothetical protein [Clostridia bacterium]